MSERSRRGFADPPETTGRVLAYLRQYKAEQDRAPTLAEIAVAVGLRHKSTAQYHLKLLAQDGIISYEPGKSRTIKILVEATAAG